MQVQPYLFFDGRCEEAIRFYEKALGAKVEVLMRNSDSPEPHPPGMLPPGSENKVMHATVKIGDSTVFMSDGMCSGAVKFEGFSLSLDFTKDEDVDRYFNILVEGGEANMPPGKTFFASRFAMVKDQFGMHWMLIVPAQM
ncbi:3-demethylubiquinone-9 3-methyltransferase [Pandoraea terrae]|uniref:3-demethylubiquinone-9 3-methyltransferase n=1 Tax=Pandoraea terrae TaxID=1537710 RepID=A0A5E4UKS5_9BURK|nr:VOC family protein [Pandoraea terrae]VVE00274.1 3-demethylubiquinone-9 3-methyltransferase [Pandoraea terrae]